MGKTWGDNAGWHQTDTEVTKGNHPLSGLTVTQLVRPTPTRFQSPSSGIGLAPADCSPGSLLGGNLVQRRHGTISRTLRPIS